MVAYDVFHVGVISVLDHKPHDDHKDALSRQKPYTIAPFDPHIKYIHEWNLIQPHPETTKREQGDDRKKQVVILKSRYSLLSL